jgi:putative membrane protein insertion efficiency factor
MFVVLRGYKRWISPLLPHACRFVPTCSEYAMEAVECHGAAKGLWLATKRLLRCQPFARSGFDPVPPAGELRPDANARTATFETACGLLRRHY